MSIHWDNGWVTSTNDRYFDIESAVRAQCLSYLTSEGRSPDDYKQQLADAAAHVREKATGNLFKRPGFVHRLIDAAHRFNAFDQARWLLPTAKSRPSGAFKRTAAYFGDRKSVNFQAAQPPI